MVTAFSPLSGPVGTSVAISGFNFDPVPTNNIVYAGAVRATVSTATPTSLNITIPVGATYDPISVTTANLTGFSSQPFLVTFTGGGSGFVAGSFASKVNYTTGANPQSVYSSDFDGDGKPDIAVVNANANILSIHRNTGSSGTISLETKLDLGTGVFPLSVCAGDVDGDGKPDIVVANYNSNTVSIFKNSSTIGTLSFAARLDFPVGSKPAYIGIADLDLDGKSDLAVANSISNTVSFVKNISTIGNISFAPKVDFATNTDPENIVLRDFDGDQITDMAVVNAGSNNVSVFRNTTTGNILSFASTWIFLRVMPRTPFQLPTWTETGSQI